MLKNTKANPPQIKLIYEFNKITGYKIGVFLQIDNELPEKNFFKNLMHNSIRKNKIKYLGLNLPRWQILHKNYTTLMSEINENSNKRKHNLVFID